MLIIAETIRNLGSTNLHRSTDHQYIRFEERVLVDSDGRRIDAHHDILYAWWRPLRVRGDAIRSQERSRNFSMEHAELASRPFCTNLVIEGEQRFINLCQSPPEGRYHINEQECLAIRWADKRYRPLLVGHQFVGVQGPHLVTVIPGF